MTNTNQHPHIEGLPAFDTQTDAAPVVQTAFNPRDMPAIADSRLRPCAGCGQPLGPTWWMVRPVRCVVDGQGMRDRAGLNHLLGSPAIQAKVVTVNMPELCVCELCACTHPLAALAMKD